MNIQRTSSGFETAFSWLIALLVPVALVLTSVRAMMTPLFLQYEYNTPGFPADSYGLTKEERLHWSKIAIDYLLNSEGIAYLGDLRFPDGSAVYNERELRHMVDVKNTVKATLTAWYLSLAVLLLGGIWAWRSGLWDAYLAGLRRGGWITTLLLGLLLVFILFGFGIFFVFFHNVFFQPGTWTFLYSDTLIRLFPERFWSDIATLIGIFSLIGGLALAFGLRRR